MHFPDSAQGEYFNKINAADGPMCAIAVEMHKTRPGAKPHIDVKRKEKWLPKNMDQDDLRKIGHGLFVRFFPTNPVMAFQLTTTTLSLLHFSC